MRAGVNFREKRLGQALADGFPATGIPAFRVEGQAGGLHIELIPEPIGLGGGGITGPRFGIGERLTCAAVIEKHLVLASTVFPRFHFTAGVEPAQTACLKILIKRPSRVRRDVIANEHACVR